MRVADYLVSYSLEINNRCLRYLAECDTHGRVLSPADGAEPFPVDLHSVYTETLLAKDSRRLCSLWWLIKPAWRGVQSTAAHVEQLRRASDVLTDATSHRRLALRLASVAAGDDEARAIMQVARRLPAEDVPSWEALNDLFADDSTMWREASLQGLADEALVERITNAYRKGYRLGEALQRDALDGWLDRNGAKLYKYAQLNTHHMELLRPALSDSTKAQLWYLDKMADSLRMRAGLGGLQNAMRGLELEPEDAEVAQAYVVQQITKMNKRIVRLVEGCYAVKPKRFEDVCEHAVQGLGLRDITLISPREARAQVEETASGQPVRDERADEQGIEGSIEHRGDTPESHQV